MVNAQNSNSEEINGIRDLDLHLPGTKSMATTGAKPDTTDSPTKELSTPKTDTSEGEAIEVRDITTTFITGIIPPTTGGEGDSTKMMTGQQKGFDQLSVKRYG